MVPAEKYPSFAQTDSNAAALLPRDMFSTYVTCSPISCVLGVFCT